MNDSFCKFLPTENGGFIRKRISDMTDKEQEFLKETSDCDPRNESDRLRYQKLAKELLFSK